MEIVLIISQNLKWGTHFYIKRIISSYVNTDKNILKYIDTLIYITVYRNLSVRLGEPMKCTKQKDLTQFSISKNECDTLLRSIRWSLLLMHFRF